VGAFAHVGDAAAGAAGFDADAVVLDGQDDFVVAGEGPCSGWPWPASSAGVIRSVPEPVTSGTKGPRCFGPAGGRKGS
jgi:hypothetical protein